jgi:DNA-directed RNA polymerase specialized sigma24 family protein
VRIAAAREIGEPIAAARRMALDACIRKLSDQQRDLLQQRYMARVPLKDLADVLKTSAAALTMRLQRIRHALLRCIEHAIATAGGR